MAGIPYRFFRRLGLSSTVPTRGGFTDGRMLSCSSRRSLRVSSAIVRRRASISACGPVSSFLSATRRTPMWHDRASRDAPLIAAIQTLEGLDFGTGRERFGCPTGQTGGSAGSWHRLLPLPPPQKFHSELYGHETFSGSGEGYTWVAARSMPNTRKRGGKTIDLLGSATLARRAEGRRRPIEHLARRPRNRSLAAVICSRPRRPNVIRLEGCCPNAAGMTEFRPRAGHNHQGASQ